MVKHPTAISTLPESCSEKKCNCFTSKELLKEAKKLTSSHHTENCTYFRALKLKPQKQIRALLMDTVLTDVGHRVIHTQGSTTFMY